MRRYRSSRLLATAAFGLVLLAGSAAQAQVALGGTAAGSMRARDGRRQYSLPTSTASFLYWDLIVTGGFDFLFSDLGAAGTTRPGEPGGAVFVRGGPQLTWVHHLGVLALRANYEFSSLSSATIGGELHGGGLVNGKTYLGLFAGVFFDVDGKLDGGRVGVYPRAGLRGGLSFGPLDFEYVRRSYPRAELYGENIFGLSLTLSYAFFETAVGLPPLPGRNVARFHE